MAFTVVIAGRPNVGKSSLFNRLSGKRLAIVNDTPGVTRDSKVFTSNIDGHEISFIDTAGWEEHDESQLSKKMVEKTINSVKIADLVVFMLDARSGMTADDLRFADIIRKSSKPIIVAINKSESKVNILENDIFKLGFGEPIYISSAHGMGVGDLLEGIISHKVQTTEQEASKSCESELLKLAIIGRPNVGKSTLFNAILGFERCITSDIPGTTRDAISHFLPYQDKIIEIIDTAGLRKKANIDEKLEELSAVESINAVRRAHISLLVIASDRQLEKQDLAIARIAIQEGKPLVLVANKYDLITDFKEFNEELAHIISTSIPELEGLPVVYTSAIKARGVNEIFKKALILHKSWSTKITTAKLNKWLKSTTERYSPPLAGNGRRIKIKYITQSGSRPPTFSLYSNIPEDLPDSYIRYLRNSIREEFALFGIPLRITMHKNKNPYDK